MSGIAKACRLRVTLRGVEPSIWREIEVLSSGSFWDLHVAIQDAMGWKDTHLHLFRLRPSSGKSLELGFPDPDLPPGTDTVLPSWETPLSVFVEAAGGAAEYAYDFGDGWEHDVELLAVGPRQKGVVYPRCTAGERACPPEDCGGVYGYARLLEIIFDPQHEEFGQMRQWLGGPFDPEAFDPAGVHFDNAKRRLRRALLDVG